MTTRLNPLLPPPNDLPFDLAQKNFFQRCVDAECIVVAVRVYATNEDFVGVRYAALKFFPDVYGPRYAVYVDGAQTGGDLFYTPELALEAWEASRKNG